MKTMVWYRSDTTPHSTEVIIFFLLRPSPWSGARDACCLEAPASAGAHAAAAAVLAAAARGRFRAAQINRLQVRAAQRIGPRRSVLVCQARGLGRSTERTQRMEERRPPVAGGALRWCTHARARSSCMLNRSRMTRTSLPRPLTHGYNKPTALRPGFPTTDN